MVTMALRQGKFLKAGDFLSSSASSVFSSEPKSPAVNKGERAGLEKCRLYFANKQSSHWKNKSYFVNTGGGVQLVPSITLAKSGLWPPGLEFKWLLRARTDCLLCKGSKC